jgi:NRAMP (natural resistance-associated macrophage protein)-like metal ion transporter
MNRVVRRVINKLGPGFITGSADDDPSGIATYTSVGAQFGLGQIWAAFISLPFMISVQEMCGRIGLVAGEGLGSILRKHYSRWLLWSFVVILLIANTINIGADLGAMADAAHLLIPVIPFPVFAILFTILILVLEIFITYKTYASVLKWLCFSLLSYVVTAFIVTTDWPNVLVHAVIPRITFSREYILALIAVLGTTISPYLFIWQTHEEVEEEIAGGRATLAERKGATAAEMKAMRTDTYSGMTFSNFMTFFIIATAAGTFYRHGMFDIQSTADAARALEPLAGRFAQLLYSVGILGTGLLAVPVLSASASYALADSFQWKQGLSKKFRDAHGFYGIITFSTLIGLLINFTGINPIKALIWAATLNGIVTPPLVAILLVVANNKRIMGKWTNGLWSNIFGIGTVVLMGIAVLLLFVL